MTRPNGARKSRSSSSESSLSKQELIERIEAGRKAAADFRHEEAMAHFEAALGSHLLNTEQRATVRCSLAESLEHLARYREAAEVMAEYETPSGRAGLHPVVLFQVWLRLGSIYGYAGDHPRAISHLKSALALAEKRNDPEDLGACHLVLGRIYRAIGETQFARDHLRVALQYHRALGQWLPLAQNYFQLGNVCISEGDYQSAREHFEQAVKIIGDRRAPLLLGSIYTNLANVILFRERGQAGEGIEAIERAIFYLKQAKNDRTLARAYSNLGYGLVHVGDWERAEQALNYAIELGRSIGDRAVEGNSLDTLGELLTMRGEFAEAEQALARAIEGAQAANLVFSEVQAYQTLGCCHLAQGQHERAIAAFEQELAIASKMEDKRSQAWAQIYLAEAKAKAGDLAEAQRLVAEIAEAVEHSANVLLIGQFRMLSGRIHTLESRLDEARHELGQAVAIFEMVTDLYREAVARYHLGRVWARAGDLARAREELRKAHGICARLGAQPMLARIEQAQAALSAGAEQERELQAHPSVPVLEPAAELSSAAILRLVGAASSRELLLHELVTIIHEGLGCAPVIVFEEVESDRFKPAAVHGGEWAEALALSDAVQAARASGAAEVDGASLHKLRPDKSPPLTLYAGPRHHQPEQQEPIEALLRLAEACLELCALRGQTRSVLGYEAQNLKPELHLPGLVFSSPAMCALVEDIHKIRGSRVTALITGESGTGKEVIAHAIHTLSERRDAPFVPFNCTVTPREVIASQLFGHKKGAFTGAVSDYPGVIRSAAGGTLFLDEVGDLALEVQPKLLRFLQEGEIQPLGEVKPIQVDVRVIAATNSDLERLVAEGKFREDLYYRLNVIRLEIPPLRERRAEIPLLVEHFLKLYSQQSGKEDITISPQALDLLMVYDWPGNVRQLANEIQRLVAYMPSGSAITERDLSPTVFRGRSPAQPGGKNLAAVTNALLSDASASEAPREYQVQLNFTPGERALGEMVADLERQLIAESMRRHKGKRELVAQEMGITRKGLYLKLRRYQME
jgi:hydrogenase-4 transcriptional activator